MIAFEVQIDESLFRRLQSLLDDHPTESIDTLFTQAVATYLAHLSSYASPSHPSAFDPMD